MTVRTRKLEEECDGMFNKECPICYTDFTDIKFILLKCNHAVCEDCFIPMLLAKSEHSDCDTCDRPMMLDNAQCPECRHEIVDDDIECTYSNTMEEGKDAGSPDKTYNYYKIIPF